MTKTDRIHLSYALTFLTPFHIGTGLSSGLLDRTVVRDAQDYLYVPGSTIKGGVREHCEQLERSLGPVYQFNSNKDQPGSKTNTSLDDDWIASPHNNKRALYNLSQHIPMVTRLFGASGYRGTLYFEDARQTENTKRYYNSGDRNDNTGRYRESQTAISTQVRLTRRTRTAVPGALFTSEFGVKGLTFEGSISGWLRCQALTDQHDGPSCSLLLLLAGLHSIERLGGNKSAGKGECHFLLTSIQINDTLYTDEAVWQEWFEHLDDLEQYSTSTVEEEEDM